MRQPDKELGGDHQYACLCSQSVSPFIFLTISTCDLLQMPCPAYQGDRAQPAA
jgi:hypothetical protein